MEHAQFLEKHKNCVRDYNQKRTQAHFKFRICNQRTEFIGQTQLIQKLGRKLKLAISKFQMYRSCFKIQYAKPAKFIWADKRLWNGNKRRSNNLILCIIRQEKRKFTNYGKNGIVIAPTNRFRRFFFWQILNELE